MEEKYYPYHVETNKLLVALDPYHHDVWYCISKWVTPSHTRPYIVFEPRLSKHVEVVKCIKAAFRYQAPKNFCGYRHLMTCFVNIVYDALIHYKLLLPFSAIYEYMNTRIRRTPLAGLWDDIIASAFRRWFFPIEQIPAEVEISYESLKKIYRRVPPMELLVEAKIDQMRRGHWRRDPFDMPVVRKWLSEQGENKKKVRGDEKYLLSMVSAAQDNGDDGVPQTPQTNAGAKGKDDGSEHESNESEDKGRTETVGLGKTVTGDEGEIENEGKTEIENEGKTAIEDEEETEPEDENEADENEDEDKTTDEDENEDEDETDGEYETANEGNTDGEDSSDDEGETDDENSSDDELWGTPVECYAVPIEQRNLDDRNYFPRTRGSLRFIWVPGARRLLFRGKPL